MIHLKRLVRGTVIGVVSCTILAALYLCIAKMPAIGMVVGALFMTYIAGAMAE